MRHEILKIINVVSFIAYWIVGIAVCVLYGYGRGCHTTKEKIMYRQTHQTITPLMHADDPYGTKYFGKGSPEGWIAYDRDDNQ